MWKERSESDKVHVLGHSLGSSSSSSPQLQSSCLEQPRDRTMLLQDLALLDNADIWLAGEGSKASEQRTGKGRQCA